MDLGHLGQVLPLIEHFASRGHEVVGAFKNVVTAIQLLQEGKVRILQAPTWPDFDENLRFPQALTYAEILLNLGYGNEIFLGHMVQLWRDLILTVKPDIILHEYSPTSIIAARTLAIPSIAFGPGFYLPPNSKKPINIRFWVNPNSSRLEESECSLIRSINKALSGYGASQIHDVVDLFPPQNRFLTTFPELDCYHEFRCEKYVGSIYGLVGKNVSPSWDGGTSHRAFVSMKEEHPLKRTVISLLNRLGIHSTQNLPSQAVKSISMRPVENLINLDNVAKNVNFAISHGGHGTVSIFLKAGRPVLLFPNHIEQLLLALQVSRCGLGITLLPDASPHEQRVAIERMIEDTSLANAASAFSLRHEKVGAEDAINEIITVVERSL